MMGRIFNIAPALAVAGLVAAAPLSAQDAENYECVEDFGGDALAQSMTEDMLSEQGHGTAATNGENEQLYAAFDACISKHSVGEAQAMDFVAANLSHMVGGELRRRMTSAGLDLAPIERLASLFIADSEFDIDRYIDDRPDEFADQIAQAEARSGVPGDKILSWIGSYIAMRSVFAASQEALGAS